MDGGVVCLGESVWWRVAPASSEVAGGNPTRVIQLNEN